MSRAQPNASETDAPPGQVRIGHDRDDRSPSLAVVEALADLAGVTPDALGDEAGVVLYDYVDPDALDALVSRQADDDIDISFSVGAYDVRVDCDEVVARPAE